MKFGQLGHRLLAMNTQYVFFLLGDNCYNAFISMIKIDYLWLLSKR